MRNIRVVSRNFASINIRLMPQQTASLSHTSMQSYSWLHCIPGCIIRPKHLKSYTDCAGSICRAIPGWGRSSLTPLTELFPSWGILRIAPPQPPMTCAGSNYFLCFRARTQTTKDGIVFDVNGFLEPSHRRHARQIPSSQCPQVDHDPRAG